jgi:hypothetical protein
VGVGPGLLLCLVYGLLMLLLVLLNLPAGILDGHIFRMCYRLGCVLARLGRLYPTEHHDAQVLSRDRRAGGLGAKNARRVGLIYV